MYKVKTDPVDVVGVIFYHLAREPGDKLYFLLTIFCFGSASLIVATLGLMHNLDRPALAIGLGLAISVLLCSITQMFTLYGSKLLTCSCVEIKRLEDELDERANQQDIIAMHERIFGDWLPAICSAGCFFANFLFASKGIFSAYGQSAWVVAFALGCLSSAGVFFVALVNSRIALKVPDKIESEDKHPK